MDRRDFLRQSALAGGTVLGAAGTGTLQASTLVSNGSIDQFNLNYAPHLGMFESHAGSDPVDQINFMAEQGFTAYEDNGMKGRSEETQRRIADALDEHDMQMGVFVAHSISWGEPALVTGEDEPRQKFLDDIRSSVEVADRVNATWMTVVPGARDLRLDADERTELASHLADPPAEFGFEEPAWTAELLREHVDRAFGVRYSVGHARRLLADLSPE